MESKKIYKQMNEIMQRLGAIGKDQRNDAQGFRFRGIDQFLNELHPIMADVGVFLAPEVVTVNTDLKEVQRANGKIGYDKHVTMTVKYNFISSLDGSGLPVTICSEGLDSGDKATNKALSAALKYCLIQTFLVPTDDIVDGDADSPEIAPKAQKGGPEKSSPPTPSQTKPRASREVLMANFLRLLSDWTKGLSKTEKDKKFQDVFKCAFSESKNWDEDTIKRACTVVEGLLK